MKAVKDEKLPTGLPLKLGDRDVVLVSAYMQLTNGVWVQYWTFAEKQPWEMSLPKWAGPPPELAGFIRNEVQTAMLGVLRGAVGSLAPAPAPEPAKAVGRVRRSTIRMQAGESFMDYTARVADAVPETVLTTHLLAEYSGKSAKQFIRPLYQLTQTGVLEKVKGGYRRRRQKA